MQTKKDITYLLLFLFSLFEVNSATGSNVVIGAARTQVYLPLLSGKRVALFSNNTGKVNNKLTLDLLLEKKINVKLILSPEHGFRGDLDAGEQIFNSVDKKTGVPIVSLYNKKANVLNEKLMQKIDIVVVDIQDVGVRFYTYYITMVKIMEACAKYNKQMILLDRPNPNGFYVDGPILDMKYKSGVGILPIPVVHGMTLGELAQMVNGRHWLSTSRACPLIIIKCLNYTHHTKYVLSIPPSPNLPNMKAIYLYPSLCFFEATPMSVGRGTSLPFQQFGHPLMKKYNYHFTPVSKLGAKNPPLLNKCCYGKNLSKMNSNSIYSKGVDLSYLIEAYKSLKMGDKFFTPFFEKLIGVNYVRKMIEEGKSANEIKEKWQNDIKKFRKQRKPYLIYSE